MTRILRPQIKNYGQFYGQL